jgi:flagellar biosynthesis protein FlhB
MSEDKQYPLTETKRKELRKQGIVPYSFISSRTFTLAVLFALSGYAWNSLFESMLSNKTETSLINFMSEVTFDKGIGLLISYSLLFFTLVILAGLVQTTFLFLPYNKYKNGIRYTLRKHKAVSITRNILSLVSIIIIPIIFVYITIKQFHYHFMNLEPQATPVHLIYLIKVASIGPLLFGISAFLFFVAVISYIYSRIRFFEHHKMSKNELTEEMKDS